VGSVTQQRQYGAQVKEVEIPQRPKKPLTPYFRYLGQVRSEMQAKNPNVKSTDLIRIIAQHWDRLEDTTKQSYITAYKNDLVSYSSILEKYNKSLTPAQKEAQQQLKLDKQLQKDKREKKKRLRELGKPKKPASPFFMYLSNNVPAGSSVSEYRMSAKKFAESWKSMSEAEKAPYTTKYKENRDSYMKTLAKWEEKMIKQGHDDLVRESSRNSPTRSRGK